MARNARLKFRNGEFLARGFLRIHLVPTFSLYDTNTATPIKAGEAQRSLRPVKFPVAAVTCPPGLIRKEASTA